MNEANRTTALAAKQPRDITEYIPIGSDSPIKLGVDIVRNLIARPTKSGKLPSQNDCLRFIALCKAKHLNPFEGDCYLLGYDGGNGPEFSQITAHQVLLKRAEANKEFDGMESGVILYGGEGPPIEREGDFYNQKVETLLGGWAKVYRRDRSRPMYRRVNFSTFDTGQSRWKKDPAGMIVKCAEADALRSTFPTHLGGLYTAEERGIREAIEYRPEPLVVEVPREEANGNDNGDDSNAELMPQNENRTTQAPPLQEQVAAVITEAGCSFTDFQRWAIATSVVPDADSLGSFDELKDADCTRLLRAKKGMITAMAGMRGSK